ncbi:receptor expression-enhancing protein 1 [Callorhinchus milii]|uniref:Receptor expression-enhancing protein n=1 Tax=Callorhinchus milii TaxID=7868 RepID=V9L366_CALMI|nr:receptor expression-enhancing protein 1 [Callorhinchus milii]|eukprot:gi/632981082/ref/XP_007907394.1/ PREDICTED: receptor expression-enhancing protein 1-like [Callorhinchus milii]
MVSWLISRLVVLAFGTLYPAYTSYKAVKTKNVKEYVRWMMYWIVFAIFTTVETFTDIFISWFPFYYEIKIAFVVWLLSPYTKGASMLYRKFIHPTLSSKEKEIDGYLVQAKERSYETMVSFGKRGLNLAATAAVSAAAKSQGAIAGRLRSFSMQDLSNIQGDEPAHYRDPLYPEEELSRRPIAVTRNDYSQGLPAASVSHPYEDETDSQEECKSDGEAEGARGTARRHNSPGSRPLRRAQSHHDSRKKIHSKEVIKPTKVRVKRKAGRSNCDTL